MSMQHQIVILMFILMDSVFLVEKMELLENVYIEKKALNMLLNMLNNSGYHIKKKRFLRIVNTYAHDYIGEKSKYTDYPLYKFLNNLYSNNE